MKRQFNAKRILACGLSLGALATAFPAGANNPNENLGFPITTGAMGMIDANTSDAGWNNAFERPLIDGTPAHPSVLRGVADATTVYLYVEAENSAFRTSDALVLAFNPSGTPGGYRKLIIRPCDTTVGGTCTNDTSLILSPKISSKTGDLVTINGGTDAPGPAPTGVSVVSRSVAAGATVKWGVEIRLNRAQLGIPANGFFPFYVNAITTNPGSFGVPASAVNFSWPVNSPIFSNAPGEILENSSTNEPRWGRATLDPALIPTGLAIMGFSNTGKDPSLISLTQPNKFAATIANGADGTSLPPPASNVSVQFDIANFGMAWTYNWDAIPPGSSAVGPKTIATNQYEVFQTNPWTPNGTPYREGLSQFDFFDQHRHQCVRVTVLQNGVKVTERQYNMNFVTVNSPFSSKVTIGTKPWLKLFPKAQSITLSEHFYNVPKDLTWETGIEGAQSLGNHKWMIRDFSDNARTLQSKVLVSDRLTLPLSDYTLDTAALAAGRRVSIAIQPGVPLTLVAEGTAKLGDVQVTPDGLDRPRRALTRADRIARPTSALQPGRAINDGQLVGSFDNFRTVFPIANGVSLVPPRGARTLQVGINGRATGITGKWRMQVVAGKYDRTLIGTKLDRSIAGAFLPIAANLPTYVVHGMLDTGETITIDGTTYKVNVPVGSYGSYIYRVRSGLLTPERLIPIRPFDPRLAPVRPIRPISPEVIQPVQPAGPG